MKRTPKTCKHIRWPDGTGTHVIKRGKWWHWTNEYGQPCESSHLGNVIWQAERVGGKVQTVTHPDRVAEMNRPEKRRALGEALGLHWEKVGR